MLLIAEVIRLWSIIPESLTEFSDTKMNFIAHCQFTSGGITFVGRFVMFGDQQRRPNPNSQRRGNKRERNQRDHCRLTVGQVIVDKHF